jgi:F-type H+-transporting ATPase subunit a
MSATIPTTQLAAETDIEVGHHITGTLFGVTVNLDTIWSTALAGGIVCLLGFLVARKASATHPSKSQLAWELIVDNVQREVEGTLGKTQRFVIELAIALFTFILIANWIELIPTQHKLPAPTADVNLTYALALLVIGGVHIYSFRQRGFAGYFKAYAHGPKVLIPLTVIEEVVKPFTLALRLFGNIFAGGIMISIIGLIPIYAFWGPNIVWKLFDMFIGLIQAFIFALLTVIYFGIAGATDHESDGAGHDSDEMGATDSSGDAAVSSTTSPTSRTSQNAQTAQPELSGAR